MAIGCLVACGESEGRLSGLQPESIPALWDDPDPRLARMLQVRKDEPLERDVPMVRVLVSYDLSNYFVDKGRPRGFEYELMTGFEAFLAERTADPVPPRVVFVAMPFERLIPAIANGRGDIAAAGITITSEREALISFSSPYRRGVREAVVRHRDADPITTAWDLAGRKVHLASGTSYVSHLERLNDELRAAGLEPVTIELADPSLQTEDLLEMVHAGVYAYTVADDHLADVWSELLEGLVVESASVNEGGELAWAVRKDNPQLRAALDAYVRTRREGTFAGNLLFRRYYETTRWIRNPVNPATRGRIARLRPYLERSAEEYGFDWLELVAIAFQESRLDSTAVSRHGAVGVMQVKLATAADPNVDVRDVAQDDEANIRAGARYLAFLRDHYFSAPEISPATRFDFMVAAYNAGPARIRRLRAAAAREGLDPNRWFGNVEHVARRRIGRETVVYVGNVNKYYVALRSMEAQLEPRTEH
ncbi:MAG: lytic transglycosylase F [bacterium]|nr:lytic transglycosylase F [bacterium]